ncbi:Hypothetical_protein [Hexamita inflata]|uniref:Hypothetical_protein n=1 Tax=Hexamita inflata TaxID=28002 RepID=A0AA86USL4_9EUKA|nr:Hypothetical protein HINF_LOCUS36003 [Hexamita inflata]
MNVLQVGLEHDINMSVLSGKLIILQGETQIFSRGIICEQEPLITMSKGLFLQGQIFIQSSEYIYSLDDFTLHPIVKIQEDSEMFYLNNTLYVQQGRRQVYEIKEGQLKFLCFLSGQLFQFWDRLYVVDFAVNVVNADFTQKKAYQHGTKLNIQHQYYNYLIIGFDTNHSIFNLLTGTGELSNINFYSSNAKKIFIKQLGLQKISESLKLYQEHLQREQLQFQSLQHQLSIINACICGKIKPLFTPQAVLTRNPHFLLNPIQLSNNIFLSVQNDSLLFLDNQFKIIFTSPFPSVCKPVHISPSCYHRPLKTVSNLYIQFCSHLYSINMQNLNLEQVIEIPNYILSVHPSASCFVLQNALFAHDQNGAVYKLIDNQFVEVERTKCKRMWFANIDSGVVAFDVFGAYSVDSDNNGQLRFNVLHQNYRNEVTKVYDEEKLFEKFTPRLKAVNQDSIDIDFNEQGKLIRVNKFEAQKIQQIEDSVFIQEAPKELAMEIVVQMHKKLFETRFQQNERQLKVTQVKKIIFAGKIQDIVHQQQNSFNKWLLKSVEAFKCE